jgi:hypothetical protein
MTIFIFNYKKILIMKNIRFNFLAYAAIIFGILLLSAGICDPDPEPDTLSVSKTAFTFSADDTKEETVTVTTNVDSWDAQASERWVNLNKENDVLRISVQNYNETESPRTAEIIVAAGTADPVKIKITQEPRDDLSIEPEVLSFEPDETVKTVSVKTNASSWNATEAPDVEWVNLSKQGNTLTVTVLPNANTDGRSATIKITAGNADEKTLTVTQAKAHTLSVSKASLSFEANASEETVTVTTTAPKWEAATSASWVTLTQQDNKLKIEVSENNSAVRKATVKITAGTAPEITVEVTQKIHTLSLSPTSLSYNADETGTKTVTITTNASSWNATTSASWVQLTQQGSTLRVNVNATNTSTSARSATIRVIAGSALEKAVTVTQSGKQETLSVSPTSLLYSAAETGTKTVTVTTNASSWNATTNVSWIQLTPQGGTLRVNVISTNPSTSARSATIRFTAGSASEKTVSVTQAGVPPPSSYPFPASTFTATGTPLASGSPTSWTGTIIPTPSTGTANYYTISKWGTFTDKVYLDYRSSKLMMDNTTKAFVLDGENYYFKAVALNISAGTGTVLSSHEVKYNSSTNTLDFSGSYNGYPVYVGYVAQYGTTISMIHVYSNVKFTLTKMASAPLLPVDNTIEKSSSNASKTDGSGNILLKTDLATPVVTFKKAPLPNK